LLDFGALFPLALFLATIEHINKLARELKMFGKPSKEPNPPEVKDLQEVMFSIKQNLEPDEDKTEINIVELPPPEVVTVVENISKILSPYFIVLVGLFLYDRNGFIGFLLIVTGVLAILGVSLKDINKLVEEGKKFFQSK
jgi:hypothetical protein